MNNNPCTSRKPEMQENISVTNSQDVTIIQAGKNVNQSGETDQGRKKRKGAGLHSSLIAEYRGD